MKQALLTAARFLRREWASGELRVLMASVIIAVAALSSVGFFTERVQLALQQQANSLLGGDMLLSSAHEFDAFYKQQAQQRKLSASETLSFPSMLLANGENHLSMVKAVDKNFPLRGDLRIADEPFAPERVVVHGPPKGEVWIEAQLLSALGLSVGDKVHLGMSTFTVSAILISEPGRGGDMFSIAPRTLLNMNDLAATQLIQPASRVRYNFLIAGENEAITAYRKVVEKHDESGVNIQTIQDARPEIRNALQRSKQFLGLAALTAVILSGVAIALAARRFAARHLDHCAIMRCVGATQRFISQVYLSQIILLGLLASLFGCALGYGGHLVLVDVLGGLMDVSLPPPSSVAFWVSMFSGMATLLAFALPPVLQLKSVPALRVLRRDLGNLKMPDTLSYALGIGVLIILMLQTSSDLKLGFFMVLGTLGAVLLLWSVAFLLIQIIGPLRERAGGAWRFGLVNIIRRRRSSIVQVTGFGLGIMVLLLLAVIRTDLLDEWQASVPEDAPNRFIINIQPDQLSDIETFFANNGYPSPQFWPMVRARLVSIDGREVKDMSFDNERAEHLAKREFNLSWTEEVPKANRVIKGKWWDSESTKAFSVEKDISKTLGMAMGDVLQFDVAGQSFDAEVTNLREVDWDSFQPNFFVLASPGLLDNLPATYMTSLYVPEERYRLLNDLVTEFSNVTIIDVAAIMKHVRSIIARVTSAVEYVFLFTLLAGLMVLYAGIQSTHDERLFENAIVRTVGGRQKQILQALLVEFVSLGVLAGLLASLMASVLSFVMAVYVLKIDYTFNLMVWVYGVIGGGVGIGLAGLLGSISVLRQPPLAIMRKLMF